MNPIRPWAILAAVIALALTIVAAVAFGNHHGRLAVQHAWDQDKLRVAKETAILLERQTVVTQVVETRVIERVRVIREQGETIVQKVPLYVPSDSPGLPGGFRLLHDAAATGLPLPAPGTDAASVPAQDAAATVAANYAGCRTNAALIEEWQAWAREQGAATKAPPYRQAPAAAGYRGE